MNCFRALVCCAAMALAQRAPAQIAPSVLQTGIEACAEDGFSSLACARGIERKVLQMGAANVSRERTMLSIQLPGRVLRLVDEASGNGRGTLAFVYLGHAGATPHHVVLRHSLEA